MVIFRFGLWVNFFIREVYGGNRGSFRLGLGVGLGFGLVLVVKIVEIVGSFENVGCCLGFWLFKGIFMKRDLGCVGRGVFFLFVDCCFFYLLFVCLLI